jgi:hypothetical protein
LDGDAVSQFRLEPFDGKNWEENIHSLRSEGQ